MQYTVEQRLLSLEIDQRRLKSDDIFDWLNQGQHIFLRNRLDPIPYGTPDSFQKIQREIDDLRLIVVESDPVTGNDLEPRRVKEYNLPQNYLHMIDPKVYITTGECDAVLRSTRLVSNFRIKDMLDERLHRTSKKSPLSTLIDNKLRIYYSDFSLGDAILTYIRQPNKIGIDPTSLTLSNCELAVHTHNDIVELAVEYAYRILNVNQNQTQ